MKYKEEKPHIISKVMNVACVIGVAMLIKRKLINDIGFFDQDFFIYFEDVELCYKAIISGCRVVFSLNAYVISCRIRKDGKKHHITKWDSNKKPSIWFRMANLIRAFILL